MVFTPVRTPCVGICSTGIGDEVCRGCKRFHHEVIEWNSYTEEQQRIIIARLEKFLAQTVANKIEIVNQNLLVSQMRHQQINYDMQQNPYCWVFALLKAGASQILFPEDYGIKVLPEFRNCTLVDIRKFIDQDFYLLSCAHFDRYFQPSV
ncbi:DUF1289 domain-containing protein [Sessilibacter sp. MAH2]